IWRPFPGASGSLRESGRNEPNPKRGDRISKLPGGSRLLEVARIPAGNEITAAGVHGRPDHYRGIRRAAAGLTATDRAQSRRAFRDAVLRPQIATHLG